MNKQFKYQNYVAVSVILTLVGIAVALGQFKIPSIMPAIMERFSMDLGSASMLMSVFTLAGIFLSLPTGFLARRFGAKNMVMASVGVMVVGTLIGMLATSGSVLVLSRAVEGVALVFCSVSAPLVLRKYVAPDKVGFASGIWSLWFSLGSFFGGVLTPVFFEALDYRGGASSSRSKRRRGRTGPLLSRALMRGRARAVRSSSPATSSWFFWVSFHSTSCSSPSSRLVRRFCRRREWILSWRALRARFPCSLPS